MITRSKLLVVLLIASMALSVSLIDAQQGGEENAIRQLVAKESFSEARKAALALEDSEAAAHWLVVISELQRAQEADQAETLLGHGQDTEAKKILDRAYRLAKKDELSSLGRIALLKDLASAKVANRHARGADFLDELGNAIAASDEAHRKRQEALSNDLEKVALEAKAIEALSVEVRATGKEERISVMDEYWEDMLKRSKILRDQFETLLYRMDATLFLQEQEKLERSLFLSLRSAGHARAEAHYMQRSYTKARLAALQAQEIDPSDRRLEKILMDLQTITESKSLMERLNRK